MLLARQDHAPRFELPVVDHRSYRAINLDWPRKLRRDPEGLVGENPLQWFSLFVFDPKLHIRHAVAVATENRRQAGILSRNKGRSCIEVQLVPLVDPRTRVVGGTDPLEILRGHEFAEAERHLAQSLGKLAAEVPHGGFALPHNAVERKLQFRVFVGRPLRLHDESMVHEIPLVNVHERLTEVGRVPFQNHRSRSRRNLDCAKGLRIRSDDNLLRAVELQSEAAGLRRCRVWSHGHVEQRQPLPEVSNGFVRRKHEDGVAGDRVIDPGLRLCRASRRAGYRHRRHGDLDFAIERLGQLRHHLPQAVGAGLVVEDMDLLGIDEPHAGPQRRRRDVADGTQHDKRQQIDPHDPRTEHGQEGTAGWHGDLRK